MDQSPSSDANSRSASQEIPCLLWNLKVYYCVHRGLLLVRTLNHMNLVHNFSPYFSKIHSDIISSFMAWYLVTCRESLLSISTLTFTTSLYDEPLLMK